MRGGAEFHVVEEPSTPGNHMHEGTRCQALFGILAAFIVIPRGQRSIAWFSAVALPGIIILTKVGGWYQGQSVARTKAPAKQPPAATLP